MKITKTDDMVNINYMTERYKDFRFTCRDTLKKYKIKFYKQESLLRAALVSTDKFMQHRINIPFVAWYNEASLVIEKKFERYVQELTFDYIMEF